MEQSLNNNESMWNKSYVCAVLANLMLGMGMSAINPLVATYMKYLNASAQLTGFLSGMFYGVAVVFLPFAGLLMTKFDKRKLLVLVWLLGSAANVGYALFHSIPFFFAFRFLSGIQFSLIGPLLMALAGDHLPKSRLAYGLGIYGLCGAIGASMAPALGEAILAFGTRVKSESLGFTLLFLSGSLIFVLALIPTCMIAPDAKTKEDIAGAGAWYKNIFSRHAMPGGIVMLLLGIPFALIGTYMFEFAKEGGIEGASIFFLVFTVMLAVSRPLSGYFTIKLGLTRIVFPALVVFGFSTLVIGFSGTLWMMLVGAALAAIGYGSAQPSIQAMCIQSEPAIRRGVATTTMYIGYTLGLFLGPYIGGLVYARSSYSFMYKSGIIAVVLALALFASILPSYRRRLDELDRA